ncbi:hypothetical protein HYDPIDRAFT_26594 [Hydnomerulius pinastri MD-312]|nr:hypothetical protein HYDPIDRAFT_26594 [Hydnomerulius pinastri MD-312]
MSPAWKAVDENDQDDPAFSALPSHLRRRIDDAFDSAVPSSSTVSRKRPRLEDEIPAGGFIIEDSEAGPSHSDIYEAGGFLIEDGDLASESRIHLHAIPRALSSLDLIADDEILEVFKNASTGWGAQNTQDEGVRRKDWRAVCAALLGAEEDEGSEGSEGGPAGDEDVEMIGDDSGSDSDEFHMSSLSSEPEEASSDEYEEGGSTSKLKKSKQQVSQSPPSKSSLGRKQPRHLTAEQKAECRQDFARFFPGVPDSELDRQRIMIKDITRVADLLKEKLKAEEVGALVIQLDLANMRLKILEMLEAFSTSADKSMSLQDFERMMIMTKMVK